ncbi:hypothetical protein JW992_06825 [candidate division KSB1 bacterium]|nr:hypothetical protein [candidate division KSB1 bacterium]
MKKSILFLVTVLFLFAGSACQQENETSAPPQSKTEQKAVVDPQETRLQSWQGELDSLAMELNRRRVELERKAVALQEREAELDAQADSLHQTAESVRRLRSSGILSLVVGIGLTVLGLILIGRKWFEKIPSKAKTRTTAVSEKKVEQVSETRVKSPKESQSAQAKPAKSTAPGARAPRKRTPKPKSTKGGETPGES